VEQPDEQPEELHSLVLQELHSDVVQQSFVEQQPVAITPESAAAANLDRRVCERFMTVLFLSTH
jgi:hypothetical protein